MRMFQRMACAVALTAGAALAATGWASTPLELGYEVRETSAGDFEYTFHLWVRHWDPTGNTAWAQGMGWGGIVFGDDPVQSPIEDFEVDPDSWPVGPWTALDLTAGPNNHGPTLAPMTSMWVPEHAGDTISWKGRSATRLELGELQFSSLQTSGGAEVFEFKEAVLAARPPCVADWTGCGCVDINSFFAFLHSFDEGHPVADLNGDGEIDINDFFIYLNLFEKGCP